MSTGPQLIRPAEAEKRNWLPLVIAAAIVLAVVGGLVFFYEHGKSAPTVTPISAGRTPGALTSSAFASSMRSTRRC